MLKNFAYGTFERTTDSRLRITLPRELERLFSDDANPPMACHWNDFCVTLMPKDVYLELVKKILAMPRSANGELFKRFFFASSTQLSVDTNHRVTLRKEDLAYLRRGNGQGAEAAGAENDWKEELILSGIYDHILIKTKGSEEPTLSAEQMMAYGDFLDGAFSSMHSAATPPETMIELETEQGTNEDE